MADTPITEITRRLEVLERRVVRWRGFALVALAVGATGLAIALSSTASADRRVSDEVVTRRLSVVDGRGNTRILLSIEGQDAFLGLTDAQGGPRAVLQAHPGGARLVLSDNNPRLVLSADPVASLATISGADGTARAMLGVSVTGHESLMLARPDGSPSATLP